MLACDQSNYKKVNEYAKNIMAFGRVDFSRCCMVGNGG